MWVQQYMSFRVEIHPQSMWQKCWRPMGSCMLSFCGGHGYSLYGNHGIMVQVMHIHCWEIYIFIEHLVAYLGWGENICTIDNILRWYCHIIAKKKIMWLHFMILQKLQIQTSSFQPAVIWFYGLQTGQCLYVSFSISIISWYICERWFTMFLFDDSQDKLWLVWKQKSDSG